MRDLITPTELIGTIAQPLAGLPACIAGSAVAAEAYGLPLGQFADLDVFCYSKEALIAAAQKLVLTTGLEVESRHSRVWARWMRTGMQGWHTNSLKLHDPVSGVEVNLIYKLVNKHPLTSLAQVLESFDFGLLSMGYDLANGVGQVQDLRGFFFPGLDPDGPLPLLPGRRDAWRAGFISQYNGIRQVGRYVKYVQYGYDMSAVLDDLIEGYMNAALYFSGRTEDDKQLTARIYYAIADLLRVHDLDQLATAGAQLNELDGLDAIMEALE